MVTVLDTYGFWKEFDAGATLPEGAQPDETRLLSEVLVEGIEFCDVLLLNKTDMVPDDVLAEIETVVDRLQPRAERVRTSYSEVDPDLVLGTERFDFADAKRSQGWKRELRGEHADHGHGDERAEHGHEDDEHDHGHHHDPGQSAADLHGVSSFVFRAEQPFRPDALAEWLEEWDGSIIRAKGVCYVAGREDVIGLSQAGPAVQAGPIGEWRPDDTRRTQLVFIGREMDEPRIREELEGMLVEAGRAADERWSDPFPL
jgi:G3E family GTPase